MFWTRLLNHHKGLELQTVTHAAQHASNAEVRAPSAPPLPEPPNEALQDLHRLTHTHTHRISLGVRVALHTELDLTGIRSKVWSVECKMRSGKCKVRSVVWRV